MENKINSYYQKLKYNQKRFNYKDYALAFLQLMGDNLKYSSKEIEEYLLNPSLSDGSFSLFPIAENLKKMFLTADYNAVAGLVYHLNDIDCSLFTGNKVNNIENKYEYFFKSKETSIYYLFNLNIAELLLSSASSKNHILIYLFLLFLPNGEDFLMFNNQGKSLLSLYDISDDNFEMLIDIYMDLNQIKFDKLINDKNNLAIQIIENYLIEIISNIDNPKMSDYKNYYPYKKINKLAKMDCFPDDAFSVLSISLTTMYPEFITWSEEYSSELEKEIMKKLTYVNLNTKVDKLKKF